MDQTRTFYCDYPSPLLSAPSNNQHPHATVAPKSPRQYAVRCGKYHHHRHHHHHDPEIHNDSNQPTSPTLPDPVRVQHQPSAPFLPSCHSPPNLIINHSYILTYHNFHTERHRCSTSIILVLVIDRYFARQAKVKAKKRLNFERCTQRQTVHKHWFNYDYPTLPHYASFAMAQVGRYPGFLVAEVGTQTTATVSCERDNTYARSWFITHVALFCFFVIRCWTGPFLGEPQLTH